MIRATTASWASCLILATVVGCGGPFRFGPPMPPGMEALSTAAISSASGRETSTRAAKNDPATAVDGGLKVQSEVLAPGDIWRDQLPELRERAAAIPRAEFQRWVVQRSAALITDRIAESLLYQKANSQLGENAGPSIQSYIDGEIRKIVTENFDGIQRRYEKSIEAGGKTLEDVRQQLRRQAIIGAYLESDVRSKTQEPTRAELYEAFAQQRQIMRRPARRSMSLIDIRIHKFFPEGLASATRAQSNEARANARSTALAALEELRSGVPFADVARRRSHGLHALDGGKWGWISSDAVRDRFLPAVAAMEDLSEGQVSDIIEVPDGFFIVRCDGAEEAFEPDFVTVQPLIHRRIVNQRYNRAIGAEVERLRSKAGIEEDSLTAFHKRVVRIAQTVATNEES